MLSDLTERADFLSFSSIHDALCPLALIAHNMLQSIREYWEPIRTEDTERVRVAGQSLRIQLTGETISFCPAGYLACSRSLSTLRLGDVPQLVVTERAETSPILLIFTRAFPVLKFATASYVRLANYRLMPSVG